MSIPSLRFAVGVHRKLVFSVPLIALALSVPWLFFEDRGGRLFGLPIWAAFALAAQALFAATLAVLIGRYWELAAGTDDEPDGDDDTVGR